MHAGSPSRPGRAFPSTISRWLRLAVLFVPALLLLCGSARVEGHAQTVLLLGGLFQMLVVATLAFTRQVWGQSIGSATTALYLIALAWLWLGDGIRQDWFSHFTQFVLLMVPLLLFGLQSLTDSGALQSRRARLLAGRLANRKEWPADLNDCKNLPEVKALRESLGRDASPALALLQNPRPQVRVAALAALEFRKYWRIGQAELVLRFAREAKEPLVRAAAVSALANLDARGLVEQMAEFLRDPSQEVRRAANEALLWDTENRWSWMRPAVRAALGDPLLQGDGPLRFDGILLKPEAVSDLSAWSSEKGALGLRAALTLAAHYGRMLHEQPDAALIRTLKQQLAGPQAAPALRIELAQLLRTHGELDASLVTHMIDGGNPASLRLIAADVLLADNQAADFPNARAVNALREIARLPNREMALTAADVVQRRLNADMGLALGQPLPPLHSRLAADVTRRLMAWAAQQERARDAVEPVEDLHDSPVPRDKGSDVIGLGSALR